MTARGADDGPLFDQSTFAFLAALSGGKDKTWFDANRDIYDNSLIHPFRRLVDVVGERLVKLDPDFEIRPQVNKTLTRINRDMRFAKGQSPYKDNMLALFYRRDRKKLDPQLFVGLQPGESWIGLYVGPELLAADAPIRAVIERSPAKLRAVAQKAGVGAERGNELATCERYGEVKQVLNGTDAADFARGPHLVVMRRVSADEVVKAGAGFASDCADRLAALYPLWALYSGEPGKSLLQNYGRMG